MQQSWIGVILLTCLLGAGCRPHSAPTPQDEIRIVSLAPSLTESLCAIGAGQLLVGRTPACNYPPETVKDIPIIGGFGQPSLELLAHAQPTLVLDTALADETIAVQIERMGIARQRVRCHTLDDIAPMLRELGRLTDFQAQAEALASEISNTIANARTHLSPDGAHPSPSVYAEVWHDPLVTIGSDTFLADLIRLAGGRPIAEAIEKDYFQIGPEQVIAENPDIILCLYMGPSSGASEAVKRRPGWEHISAVQNNCVFDELDHDILLRPGPRLLAGLSAMRACVDKAMREKQP